MSAQSLIRIFGNVKRVRGFRLFGDRVLGRLGDVSNVTRILDRAQQGDPGAADELLPLIYEELRKLAAVKMADQAAGHTLQPTALVHEAYLRLVGSEQPKWQNSRHFFAAAAEAMRHILVDSARKKGRLKRGGDWQRLDLDAVELASDADPDSLLAVHEALEELFREDPDKAELVKLRFFGGLSLPQAAQTLGWSLATAKRRWAFARAWLYRYITKAG
jgi:RNA polymerase sigma factor (TIGR02999 family)